jgi:hypothetical protein
MTGSTARDIVDQATKNATGRDRPARVAAFVLATCLAVAGFYFGPRIVDQGRHIDQLQSSYDQSTDSVRQLADQVRRLGGTPVVQPPPATATASVDPAEVRQAARTAVAEYCAAPTHPCRGTDGSTPPFDAIVDAVVAKIPAPKKGDDGQDGANATATQVADAVATYCGQPSEPCRGTNGHDGQTPACVSEQSQCRGDDGQPPAGWTTTYPDGSTGSCTRAPDFDPAAPRYTCTRSAPPSADPPLPLGG